MDPVVHFEMPAKDMKRMKKFYTSAFGWKMQDMGPKMGGYVVAGTTEVGKDHRPKEKGCINGGFYPKQPGIEGGHVVIAVKSLAASMKKVQKAGGKIMNGPTDIPGVGLYAAIMDTEGNRVAILQPKM